MSGGGIAEIFDRSSLVLQVKDDNGNYVNIGSSSTGGLVNIIGLLGQGAGFEIKDLPAGEYRINGNVGGLIGALQVGTIKATITETNPLEVGHITTVAATGNVIDENDIATDSTIVTEVNGKAVNGATSITGDHGELVINPDGSYIYTPNADVGEIGQTEQFVYTIVDPVTNSTDSATLTVGIESDYPAVNFPIDAVDDVAATELIIEPLVTTENLQNSDFKLVGRTKTQVEFDIAEGNTGSVELALSTSGVVGLLDSATLTLEKQNPNGSWTTVGTTTDSGIFDVIGILGEATRFKVDDLEVGNYRVTGRTGVLSLGTTATLKATVTEVDPDVPGIYSSQAAVGNVITANDDATPSTRVSDVDGTAVNDTTVIDGDYGTLTIKPDGSYFYTPDGDVTVIGQTEEFEYTIIDDFNNTDTATITINITSDWPAPAPLAARMMLDDSFTLADDADDADAIDLPETSLSVSDEGLDVLSFDGADQVISLADIMEPEMIDISGTGANTLNVAAEDVNSAIYVQGDSDDTVDLAGDNWSTVEQTTSGGEVYDVWQSGNDAMTQIYIDPNVNII
ncbi:type calcium-binding region:RTX domain-containing protein [marine sediment metagenome]|uniref:Type calcium-binding region:RTX domain-containing protein n=1 Tax=marine sediment metagenome TaxID=412755 RepID=A0A1B6NYB8_9ZZZZ